MAAQNGPKPQTTTSLAQDLFTDMGKKVESMKLSGEDESTEGPDQKTVEEVESMCMNCHDNVCHFHSHYRNQQCALNFC